MLMNILEEPIPAPKPLVNLVSENIGSLGLIELALRSLLTMEEMPLDSLPIGRPLANYPSLSFEDSWTNLKALKKSEGFKLFLNTHGVMFDDIRYI